MRLPTTGRWTRLLALIYGAVVFIWLSLEDNATWPVTLLGAGLAALIISLTTLGKIGGVTLVPRVIPWLAALMGVVVGVGASISVTGLMFFKNAIHAHIFLDFPPGLMLALLQRAPAWGIAGGLTGLGLGLAWLALRDEVTTNADEP